MQKQLAISDGERHNRLDCAHISLTSEEYERITSQIVSSIYQRVEGIDPEQVRYGRNNKYMGISGYKHQIDVSLQGAENLLLVECKCWRSTVGVDIVLVFLGRVHDISQNFNGKIHSVIVTTKGFQSGAQKVAEYYKITLAEVRSADEFVIRYKNLISVALGKNVLSMRGSLRKTVYRSDGTVEDRGEQ